MQDITELERRITAALERIGRGVESLSAAVPMPSDNPTAMLPESDFAALSEKLDEERMLNAQLQERLRAVHLKDEAEKAALTAQIAALTAELSELRDLAENSVIEPEYINQSLQSELDALRAARASEAEELSEIIAALNPLIEEAAANA
ncbi:hypothetical protein GCM10010873_27550 [Cypionkella aquatica]|uniref:Uncharacterized protein n=1 Tax=Cypionkella aquatica TaxID=1756042 RepID=A0AA37U3G2_9RHOB|nr:hypothetical protein [Cypionkella aquatica]GLS87781.1 hypothetical protein GCM10010873_27550 [Cypionkella aquatica]